MTLTAPPPAAEAYDALADFYDLFTAHHRHDVWLARLEALALECGLAGRRVLDVGCGTGKSLLPLAGRGYEVTGCDQSAGMLGRARSAVPDDVELFEADMRDLPDLGHFDLITCLDDAVNYLLGDDDLVRALAGMARLLAPGGLAVFDVNTLRSYRTFYAETHVVDTDDAFLCWRGHGDASEGFPRRASATIEIFARAGTECWQRSRSEHRQRHWDRSEVLRACAAAGLRCVAIRGQRPGAVIEREADEDVHTKVVYVAARP
jgi:SAM-dependent methyltransferase